MYTKSMMTHLVGSLMRLPQLGHNIIPLESDVNILEHFRTDILVNGGYWQGGVDVGCYGKIIVIL